VFEIFNAFRDKSDPTYIILTAMFSCRKKVLFNPIIIIIIINGDRSSTVVKVLYYKSEGRWFDPSWCHWNFSLTYSFRSHYGPGVDLASNTNQYQEHFLGVKAAGA